MPELEQKLAQPVRTMQIVILAMIVVPLIFAAVVLVIGSQAPEQPAPIRGEVVQQQGREAVGRIALMFGLVALFAQQWMGRFVTKQAVQNLARQAMKEPERLGEAFVTGTVVSCAINEMAAFLNLIAYMSSQSWTNLAMGLLLIASNALKMPTVKKVAAWIRVTVERLRVEQGVSAE
ncbi:hypothetical protein Pla108_25740 [Botrimarina colliarenosi]|uniref:Uncharacterized protein n=1 Tax=Botrimarina colliarenosi TaxID=2528001 RepID=A0A5C6ABM4_9BACT|nr:hypothetical protein [Botrimarina colliarenosi]TWT96800.1 hypothetical protein Pla108_25740 [Botrimarina colliarenosi]